MRRVARRSLCHALLIDVQSRDLLASDAVVHPLRIDGPRPALGTAESEPTVPEGEGPLDSWTAVVQEILRRWI